MPIDERAQKIIDAIEKHDKEFLLSDEFLTLSNELKVPQEHTDNVRDWVKLGFPSMLKLLRKHYNAHVRLFSAGDNASKSEVDTCEDCSTFRSVFTAASEAEQYGEALKILNQFYEHRKQAHSKTQP
jgi:hypothetical protein